MGSLIVFRTSPSCSSPAAANSMPSPIEHMPCGVEFTATGNVVFNLLPAREWSSLIPLPMKPAGKMPSSIFHIYSNGDFATPRAALRRAEEAFDCAASTFVKLVADGNDITGLAKPKPVRHTPAQRAAVAATRRPAKVVAPVPRPVRVGNKRFRSLIPVKVKVKAKSMAKVNVKSILKPTRNDNAVYVQHCSKAPPKSKGCLRQPSEAIATETWSRFPTSEWNLDQLPINLPDRYDDTIFLDQEMRRALNLGALPTIVEFHEHLVSDS